MPAIGKSIKNNNGVPIWVRPDCKCLNCTALRKLDKERRKKKK